MAPSRVLGQTATMPSKIRRSLAGGTMNRKIAALQVGIVVLASAHFAKAQEQHRLGLVSRPSSSAMTLRVEAFRQAYASLAISRGRTSQSSIDGATGRTSG